MAGCLQRHSKYTHSRYGDGRLQRGLLTTLLLLVCRGGGRLGVGPRGGGALLRSEEATETEAARPLLRVGRLALVLQG